MFEIGRILEIIFIVFVVSLSTFIGIKLIVAIFKEAFLDIKNKKKNEEG